MSIGQVSYLIVDTRDLTVGWDRELHSSQEACINSLCGPGQMYGNDDYDPRPNWRDIYEIRRVMPLVAMRGKS